MQPPAVQARAVMGAHPACRLAACWFRPSRYSGAATLIQSMARGRIDRKNVQKRQEALSRIQASARGHLVRKETARKRSVLLDEATHAVTMKPMPEQSNYKVQGVEELVEVSASRVGDSDETPKELTEAEARAHAQRLGLVRHALRNMTNEELSGITAVAAPDVPTLVLAGAVRHGCRAHNSSVHLGVVARSLVSVAYVTAPSQLCVVFQETANWASASKVLANPNFRNKAASLKSEHLTVRTHSTLTPQCAESP